VGFTTNKKRSLMTDDRVLVAKYTDQEKITTVGTLSNVWVVHHTHLQ